MSYLALARKYRPRRFEDVMGQSHVVRALSHALDTDRLHPAILLTGTRGVGKTTLARIIAKSLNCETGVSASPCGVCAACSEVDAGRFVDLMEIDAASNNGVDDVRQLIDNAHYPPVRGRYKVYLIDEVHMLSKPAFNALLKTLEEPPPYLKFILATTDPQKLLVTVLSRCLQFNLKRLPLTVIRDQLARVLANEGHAAAPEAVLELARAADGSMRDGLSLLDQALAFAGGQPLALGPVEEMLGVAGRRSVFDLLEALADGNGAALAALFQQLEMQAPDYAALLDALAAALQRIAVLQVLPSAQSEDDEAALLALRERFAPEDVQLNYQIAIHGRRDLPWAPDPRVGFEMTVLRMHAFRPEEGDAKGGAGHGGTTQGQTSTPSSETTQGPRAATQTIAAAAPLPTGAPLPQDVVQWAQCVEQLRLDGMDRQLARQCAWIGVDGGMLRLSLESRARSLLTEPRRQTLEAALAEYFAQALTLRIDVEADAAAVDSPARQALAAEQRRIEQAHASISADPVVRAFQDHFGAQIRPGSIHPLDS